jgi:hypothetical protein
MRGRKWWSGVGSEGGGDREEKGELGEGRDGVGEGGEGGGGEGGEEGSGEGRGRGKRRGCMLKRKYCRRLHSYPSLQRIALK